PPSDAALDPLAAPYRSRINHPDLPTIYPPMTQAVFLLASAAGAGVTGMKLIIVLFDLGTILALAAILKQRGMSPALVAIYAWSPLAILETAWSGHADPVGVCLLMTSILAMIRGRKAGSVVLAGLSGAAKYPGWLAIPSLIVRAGWRGALALPA